MNGRNYDILLSWTEFRDYVNSIGAWGACRSFKFSDGHTEVWLKDAGVLLATTFQEYHPAASEFESTYKPKIVPAEYDSDGSIMTRRKIAKKGRSMYNPGFEFSPGNPGTLDWEAYDGLNKLMSQRSWAVMRCYDASGTQTTDPNVAVLTEVDITIPTAFEIYGGELETPASLPQGKWKAHVVAAPDVPAASGGNIVLAENIRLGKGGKTVHRIDGISPKEIPDIPGVNTIRFAIKHPQGVTTSTEFQIVLNLFAEGVALL